VSKTNAFSKGSVASYTHVSNYVGDELCKTYMLLTASKASRLNLLRFISSSRNDRIPKFMLSRIMIAMVIITALGMFRGASFKN